MSSKKKSKRKKKIRKNNRWKLYRRLKSMSKEDHRDDQYFLTQWTITKTFHRKKDGGCSKNNCALNKHSTHTFYEDDGHSCEHVSCLCSKYPIFRLCYLVNKITSDKCIVGSCCIKKFALKVHNTQMKVLDGTKKGKRYCEVCNNKLKDSWPEDNPIHDSCRRRNRQIYGRYRPTPKLIVNDPDDITIDSEEEISEHEPFLIIKPIKRWYYPKNWEDYIELTDD